MGIAHATVVVAAAPANDGGSGSVVLVLGGRNIKLRYDLE